MLVFDIVLYGFALACIWALIAILFKFNFKDYFMWWVVRIVPMCIVIVWALQRLGILKLLETR